MIYRNQYLYDRYFSDYYLYDRMYDRNHYFYGRRHNAMLSLRSRLRTYYLDCKYHSLELNYLHSHKYYETYGEFIYN